MMQALGGDTGEETTPHLPFHIPWFMLVEMFSWYNTEIFFTQVCLLSPNPSSPASAQ
jgi:hypothetical protein